MNAMMLSSPARHSERPALQRSRLEGAPSSGSPRPLAAAGPDRALPWALALLVGLSAGSGKLAAQTLGDALGSWEEEKTRSWSSYNWSPSTQYATDGLAAVTPKLTSGGSAWLCASSVRGPGYINFVWAVDTGADDYVKFSVDGTAPAMAQERR